MRTYPSNNHITSILERVEWTVTVLSPRKKRHFYACLLFLCLKWSRYRFLAQFLSWLQELLGIFTVLIKLTKSLSQSRCSFPLPVIVRKYEFLGKSFGMIFIIFLGPSETSIPRLSWVESIIFCSSSFPIDSIHVKLGVRLTC